ncbi:MAG: helix-hairpin-helix domain-containing protein [Acidobacteria bacterium]|nr:helix-hairpin-helix domain-containing protein [Acidobacteriota bacterium]
MIRRIVPIIVLVLAVAAAAQAASPATGVVNINTATAAQLQMLPHVGPALAKRIVAFRKANGPFEKTAELVAVRGIGERSIKALMPYIATTGTTTLSSKIRLPRRRASSGPAHVH